MSAGGLARLGVRCADASTGMATLGVFCGDLVELDTRGGGEPGYFPGVGHKLAMREDEEILAMLESYFNTRKH